MNSPQSFHTRLAALLVMQEAARVHEKGVRTSPVTVPGRASVVDRWSSAFIQMLADLWGASAAFIDSDRVNAALVSGGFENSLFADLAANVSRWGDESFAPLTSSIIADEGAAVAGNITPLIDTSFFFDVTDPGVTSWIQNQTAELVKNMTEQQILSTKTILDLGFDGTLSKRDTLRLLRESVTLTNPEAKQLSDYYLGRLQFHEDRLVLEEGLSRATAKARARDIATRERARRLKLINQRRAKRIYDTEITRAKGIADEFAFNQSIAQGKIKRAWKTWMKGGFDDNWPSSDRYDGKRIQVTQSFWDKYGQATPSTMLFGGVPGEINERCYLEYDIVF